MGSWILALLLLAALTGLAYGLGGGARRASFGFGWADLPWFGGVVAVALLAWIVVRGF